MKKKIIFNKKGDLEIDEVIKIMLGLVFLLVLIVIMWYLRGHYSGQETSVKDAFNFLK